MTQISIKQGTQFLPPDYPYTIAEAGNNHNGDLETAIRMIDVAVETGCDAVKFQKRDIDHMLTGEHLDRPFMIERAPHWGNTYRKVREFIELDASQCKALKDYCLGKIDFICTPFDLPSLEILERIGVDAYKIAAFSLTDTPLLEAMARTGKPIILSAGAANEEQINEAVDLLKNTNLILLHCISSYPMKAEDANLWLIHWFRDKYDYPIGFSDHENGISLGPVAYALGARFFEKHYTLDSSMPGFDHAISIEPTGLKKWVRDLHKASQAIASGQGPRRVFPCEQMVVETKIKTVVSSRAIAAGEVLTKNMLTTKGPNIGLPPKMIPKIVGRKTRRDIAADTHITAEMIEW